MSDDETLDEHESITTMDAHARGVVIDGRYRLGAALASGGMGTVYEARHLRCGYTVALKLSAAGQHMSARLLREAQLAVQLDDPGVVRVLDIGEHEGRCYIAMERLHGRDLEELIDGRGPLPVQGACSIMGDVAATCARMHAAAVIHRDLKPANLFLVDGGAVKVIDFGLAKDLDAPSSLTRSGIRMGTPAFMAPEQVTDSRGAGPAADCYALGGILLYALTGHAPHDAPSMLERLTQAIVGDVQQLAELRPDAPEWLGELVARLLDKDPERRPSAAEMARTLSHAAAVPQQERRSR